MTIQEMTRAIRALYGVDWLFIPDAYHAFDRMYDAWLLRQRDIDAPALARCAQ